MCFTSLQSWMEFLSTQDITIGKRIHGCIASLQTGVPAILINHDLRTYELASVMGVPTVNVDTISSDTTLESILHKISFNKEEFIDKRERNRQVLKDIFSRIWNKYQLNK